MDMSLNLCKIMEYDGINNHDEIKKDLIRTKGAEAQRKLRSNIEIHCFLNIEMCLSKYNYNIYNKDSFNIFQCNYL